MKKFVSLVICLVVAVSAIGAIRYSWSGYGKDLTATTTAQTVDLGKSAYSVSLVKSGFETVYAVVNTPTNSFVATNSIPIKAGYGYAWGGSYEHGAYTNICFATLSSTSTVAIAFE